MGALVSAPLSALATGIGGCCGSCIATGCCKLAASGTVESAQAARCVLVWLQVFAAALAVLASTTAERWLPWSCGKLGYVGLSQMGICECSNVESWNRCWRDQLVYRSEASLFVVLVALSMMTVSGCASSIARTNSVAKFMAVLLLAVVFLFVPNGGLDVFGTFATTSSAIFLVAQSILLIDFAYTWNETWYGYALAAYRREVSRAGYRKWTGLVLAASGILLLGSLAGTVYLYVACPDTGARATNVASAVLALILLIGSITDWCEHGALLTSTVVMAYSTYLVCEALAVLPNGAGPQIPVWISLGLCAGSLVAFAYGGAVAPTSAPTAASAPGGAAEEGTTAAGSEGDGSVGASETKDFATQCVVHIAASLFVAASLAPRIGETTFALRVVAIFASLALYGWSLVAPKVLTGRTFG